MYTIGDGPLHQYIKHDQQHTVRSRAQITILQKPSVIRLDLWIFPPHAIRVRHFQGFPKQFCRIRRAQDTSYVISFKFQGLKRENSARNPEISATLTA